MKYNIPNILINKNKSIFEALQKLNKIEDVSRLILFVTDDNRSVLGSLTDGDIRRLHIKNDNLKTIKRKDINQNFIYEVELNKYINKLDKTVQYIPILKDKKQILGIAKII